MREAQSMIPPLPVAIRSCLTDAAQRLGRALNELEWPSGGKDAAPAEINALINLMFYLQSQPAPFAIYAEGTCEDGRIDMMACDGEVALAVEAKNFGAIQRQSEAALRDLNRMLKFRPSLGLLRSGEAPRPWWGDAKQRWGIILIQSFRGKEIADAWQSPDDNAFQQHMSAYRSAADRLQTDVQGEPAGFHKLFRAFPAHNRGIAPITDGQRWADCGQGWFLWGAVPLQA